MSERLGTAALGQGVSLLINTRIQVQSKVGGTRKTWRWSPGFVGALGAWVKGDVLWACHPHPEIIRPLEMSSQLSVRPSAA